MSFKVSFCDPFQPRVIEFGIIEKDKILDLFNSIRWDDYLDKMNNSTDQEIYFSPSFEIENIDNHNGISISAFEQNEWGIFFKRPKLIKKYWGLSQTIDQDFLTDLTVHKEEDIRNCINALINNDLEFLERTIK